MFVNRAPPPPPPAPVNLVLQHWCKALQSLYCTIRRLFVLFVAYSRTIRTIRRLFADYSYYSSTIRGLFVLFVDYSRTIRTIRRLFALFVDYSHYSLHYSSFINCLSQSTKCSVLRKQYLKHLNFCLNILYFEKQYKLYGLNLVCTKVVNNTI